MTKHIGDHANSTPRIAVDAMGGDFAPSELVKGAVEGARNFNVEILLVGDKQEVESHLQLIDTTGSSIKVIPSEGRITEEEHPLQGLRSNPRASVAVATALVKENIADAMITMGPTGAAMASATLGLGLLGDLDRPCVGGPFLGMAPHTAILDLGSNIDCRPKQLLNFATMGCVFAHQFFGVEHPRVGLLSVGAEEGKGNRQTKESYTLFKHSHLNFIGNIEGMDLLAQKAHVVVCDGFIGNILLKFAEGLGDAIASHVKAKLTGKVPQSDLEILSRDIWEQTNLSTKMSGPLFGINGNVIIGHGASKSEEVVGAINTAKRCIEIDLVNNIKQELDILETTPQA